MKKASIITILIFVALVSAGFNFLYLVNKGFAYVKMTDFTNIVTTVNNIVFYITLFVIIMAFFFNQKNKKNFSLIYLLFGIVHLFIMFSFVAVNYYYLIPIIFNLFASLLSYSYDYK